MKLVTFSSPSGGEALGACIGDEVLDLSAASHRDPIFDSMLHLIDAGHRGLRAAADLVAWAESNSVQGPTHRHSMASVRIVAPIPRPRKNVFCVGLNFRSHVEQNAVALGQPIEIPDVPLFFSKPTTSVVGPGDGIRCDPRLTSMLDYEVELAVVIGTGGTWIPREEVWDHIFGFTLVNDVSARDLQWRTSQFFYGKGLDSYCPMGPAIVTVDEMPPLDEVLLELSVNGEPRQSEAAGNMLFSPDVAISELSRGLTLEAGDVISMGTPGGCGYQLVPQVFLQAGDAVECRATGIGSLANPVVDVIGSVADEQTCEEEYP